MTAQFLNTPCVVPDHAEYLRLNGFDMEIISHSAVVFSTPEYQLLVVNDVLIVKKWCKGDGQNADGYRELQRFAGVTNIDEMQWMFLLDAFNVIRVHDFIRKACKELRYDFFVQLGQSIIGKEDKDFGVNKQDV